MTMNINEQTDFNSVLEDISFAVTKLQKNVCFVCSGGCLTHILSWCLCSMTHRFSPLRLPLVDRVIVGHSRPHRVCVPVFVCLHGMSMLQPVATRSTVCPHVSVCTSPPI